VRECTHRPQVVKSHEVFNQFNLSIQLVCESCVIQIVPVRRDGTNTIDSCRKSRLCTRTVNGAGFSAWLRSHDRSTCNPISAEHARPDVIVKMERQTRPRMIAWSPTLTSTAAEAFQASAVGSSLPWHQSSSTHS